MKHLAIMFLLALCWLPRAWAEPQAPLRVAMLPYPDYAEYDAERRAEGHAVRVIRRLLERAGYASEIRLLPVARVRLGLMSGELDLWLGLNNQVDLEAYTLQTQSSFGALPINLYYRPDEAAPSWPDSLRGRTLILITNYNYSLPVSRTLQDPRLALQTRTSSSHAGAIRMLLRGRGDYLLDYRGQVAAALDTLGMQTLPHVTVDQPAIRLFVSRQRSDARALVNRLDQAFDALVDEGVDMDVTRQQSTYTPRHACARSHGLIEWPPCLAKGEWYVGRIYNGKGWSAMQDTFKVSCKGERDSAIDEQQLRDNLQRLGFGSKQLDRLLNGTPVTIKSGLSQAMAERYQKRLADAGLITQVLPDGAALVAPPAPPAPPAEPIQQPAPAAPQRRLVAFQFTGNGSEYFGIWIVNILLMVVTLGFYAPWAKVRNLQYFYGHTVLEKQSFQYLADPWVIFRGRLVAVAAFIVWSIASNFFPIAAMALLVIFIPLVPWIITRSLKFHAINSAYRNIRFDFAGTYWQAVKVVYLWPLAAILTLGLLVPLAVQRWHQFLTEGARYGRSAFALNLSVGQVYVFFLKMLGVFVGLLLVGGVLSLVYQPIMAVFVMAAYLALFGYFMAGLTNLVINSIQLEQHGFASNLGKRRMVWIFFTNSLLILLTMGFFTPWAKVRMARYRASCSEMEVAGDLDGFIAGEAQHAGAVGMELGDAFDVGFGFG